MYGESRDVLTPFYVYCRWSDRKRKNVFRNQTTAKLKSLCTESRFEGGIIWCYSVETAVPRQQLKKLRLNITYQDGLPESYGKARGERSLIILDDLLNEA